MSPLGYHGRILRVDLTSGTTEFEDLDESTCRHYAGGSLLATWILLRETPPGLDAFDPRAMLVICSSVVAGHRACGLPRFSVTAKSPLTGGVGEARAEGPWGVALKDVGIDAIVVTGRTARPTVLIVDGEGPSGAEIGPPRVHLEPADELRGLDTTDTADRLVERYPRGHVAAIGPAGERLVRFASIVTDRSFAAPRMGLGAVMGSKSLKAIVLRGGSPPPVADQDALAQINASYARRVAVNPLTRWQHEPPGFGAWVGGVRMPGYLGVENYRTAVLPDPTGYRHEVFLDRLAWSHGGCPGCPSDCIKGFAADSTDAARTLASEQRTGGLHQEAIAALGPNLGVPDAAAPIAFNERCLRLGLDPVSLGFTLSFVMEARAAGALDPHDLDGLDLQFGDVAAIGEVIEQVAQRSGPGDLLAEGVRRVAARVASSGRESVGRYALEVKGLEMVSFEPRTQTNLALGYATAPFGPRYDVVEHDWDFDADDPAWPHTLELSRPLGITSLVPMDSLDPLKVRNYTILSTLWSALDALNVCIFASAPTRLLSLDDVARIVEAITGWQTTADEVMAWGARRMHLLRIYNLREGLTAADDDLPDRFFEDPIDVGRFSGVRLDREAFHTMIAAYYDAMGWDEAGVPTATTRAASGLDWTIGMEDDAWASTPPSV
jgi:aldehyde:ferredoxin oxidoreductase